MTRKQRDMLRESITRYGFMQPLVVTANMMVVNGNMKYTVVTEDDDLKRKHPTVPCYVLPKDTSEHDILLIAQALNKVHGEHIATADAEIFKKLVQAGRQTDISALLGKSSDVINTLIRGRDDALAGITATERYAEKHARIAVRQADEYKIGEHTVICGDCTEHAITDRIQKLDGNTTLTLTDPPYGINVVNNEGNVGQGRAHGAGASIRPLPRTYKPVHGDDRPYDPAPILRTPGRHILFGANRYSDRLPVGGKWLVWIKKTPDMLRKTNMSDCELMWTDLSGQITQAYQHTWFGVAAAGKRVEKVHPTQKPVEMLEQILNDHARKDDVIYDPYAGSGSVAVAAHRTNHASISVEIEPAYVEVIIQRLEAETGEKHKKL